MFTKKINRLICKFALFAIIFTSFAPAISYALSNQNGAAFNQEICSSSGQKIYIKIVTTKGQQQFTEIDINPNQNTKSKSIGHHLDHCPFCVNIIAADLPPINSATIIAKLADEAKIVAVLSQPVVPHFSVVPPPSQAPPAL